MKLTRKTRYPAEEILEAYYNNTYKIQDDIQQKTLEINSDIPARAFSNLIENIPLQHGNRALDIGCGTGDLASVLLTKFRAVYGTEISTEAIRIGRLLYPRVNFSSARGVELPDSSIIRVKK